MNTSPCKANTPLIWQQPSIATTASLVLWKIVGCARLIFQQIANLPWLISPIVKCIFSRCIILSTLDAFKKGRGQWIKNRLSDPRKINALKQGPQLRTEDTIKLEMNIKNMLSQVSYDFSNIDFSKVDFNHLVFNQEDFEGYDRYLSWARIKPRGIDQAHTDFLNEDDYNLVRAQKKAININTLPFIHSYINKFLRTFNSDNEHNITRDELIVHAAMITSGLNTLPDSSEDQPFVFRIECQIPPEVLSQRIEAVKRGATTLERGFLSTSSEKPYNQPSTISIVLETAKAKNIKAYSQAPHEREFLIPPTQIQWMGHEVIKNGDREQHVFFARAVTIPMDPHPLGPLPMSIQASEMTAEHELSNDSSRSVTAIREALASKDRETLESLVTDGAAGKINKLIEVAHQQIWNVSLIGRNSANRQLLTDTGWNDALRDPEAMLALFALEALEVQFGTSATFTAGKASRIAEMLFFGLKHQHPAVLETLILNQGTSDPEKEVMEYVRRKNIHTTFVPILKALYKAQEQATGTTPNFSTEPPSRLDQPYLPAGWKEYRQIFNDLLMKIDESREDKLLAHAAGFSSASLQSQAASGFKALCERLNIKSTLYTVDEIALRFVNSSALLNYLISHSFDPLHIKAVLKGKENCLRVETSEGTVPLRDIFVRAVDILAEEGVSEDNAIAAEQLYVRLMILADQLGV